MSKRIDNPSVTLITLLMLLDMEREDMDALLLPSAAMEKSSMEVSLMDKSASGKSFNKRIDYNLYITRDKTLYEKHELFTRNAGIF